MDRQRKCAFACAIIGANSFHMFNTNELKEGVGQSMDPSVGVQDVFATMWAMPRLFKTLTNFTLADFDKLVALVVHTIVSLA
ncbi:unnamed protein product [Sphagnum troendelagicum]|uniref:Uncharacterized protein n=1 Tax=Sphagnum troendelagicum TaxID=128251 RepID=A0ABP0U6B1_9BRYO